MLTYKKYMVFLFVFLAVGIVVQMLLPVVGLVVAIGIFIAFLFLLRRQYMNRMRGYGGGSSTGDGRAGGFFGLGFQGSSGGVRYVCLVCNNKHKGGSCPRCGSKMQRADF